MLRQMFEAFMKHYGYDVDKFVEYIKHYGYDVDKFVAYSEGVGWVFDLEEYLYKTPSRDWIAYAFEWSDTEEGYDYWYDVEGLWLEWLDADLG